MLENKIVLETVFWAKTELETAFWLILGVVLENLVNSVDQFLKALQNPRERLSGIEADTETKPQHSGIEADTKTKPQHSDRLHTKPVVSLPLTTASVPVYTKENGVMWSSSPDRLELHQKPIHNFNSPVSPCISESGSDIYSKREVIQKLRQQLKRCDDMILEMQDQIAELQSSVTSQRTRSDHLQSLLEAANRDLFDSEREIQRLRKVIADICADTEKPNGNINGFQDLECLDKGIGRNVVDKIEILKKEIGELKDLIEGKDYLL
ncbi:hypothetical protein HanPI659440_Chr03g0117291 [Helianthus annuus]|nr:hypothetical protein HanPI659440_Chr03g0117291 [Helianthus annuus]